MYSKYFGIYLLGKGLLTKDQFFEITETTVTSQDTLNIPSIIAIPEGFDEIQKAAVSNQRIITAILEKKILSAEQMQQAIIDYNHECSLIEAHSTGFQGLDYEIIVRILLDASHISNEKMRDFFYNYIALLLTNIAKYLNDEPAIWTNYAIKDNLPRINQHKAWLVSQVITIYDWHVTVHLLMTDKLLPILAGSYSQENFSSINEFALDAISEFFNFNNGLFVTNLTNAGINAEISMPKIMQDYPAYLETGYIVPIGLKDGQAYLIIARNE